MPSIEKSISHIITSAISKNVFPGCVVGVISDGNKEFYSFGKFTYDEESKNVEKDTLFDIASLTKVIPTSLLALHFLERKMYELDTPVSCFLPDLTGRYKQDVTIRNLLTQTVTFPFSLSQFSLATDEVIRSYILTCDLKIPPGEKFTYTNSSSILLGWVVEKVSGKKLSELAQILLFNPLQMSHTTFFPVKETVVPTEITIERGLIRGEVHDESAHILSRNRSVVGSAGLFSTAEDILKIINMILENGVVGDKRFFKQQTIELMEQNFLTDLGYSHGLGWELNQEYFMLNDRRGSYIGKTGFTGCSMVLNRKQKKGFVMLSNYTYPKRREDREALHLIRQSCANIVFS